jgi:aminopeptidase N
MIIIINNLQYLIHTINVTLFIQVKVIKADDVDDVFDTISYSKSASVIRMV